MKLETGMELAKGTAFAVAGFAAVFGTGFAQWVENGQWPPKIVWVVTIVLACGGAANGVIAFTSGSFSEYMKNRKNGSPPPDVPKQP